MNNRYLNVRDRLRKLHAQAADVGFKFYCAIDELEEANTVKQEDRIEAKLARLDEKLDRINEKIAELLGRY